MLRFKPKFIFIGCCVLPLLVGGILYLGFRTNSLLMFKWFKIIGLESLIIKFRDLVSPAIISKWVIYSLPNGLWSFSFIFFILFFTEDLSRTRKLWLVIVISIIVGCELLQKLKLIRGTFDIFDLTTNIFFITLALGIYYLVKENLNDQNNKN